MELWRQFETRIKNEAPIYGVTCWQIPLEVRIFSRHGKKNMVPVKSHPDFVAGISGLSAFFDAKSTENNAWNLQDNVFRKDTKANKLHQWQKLEEAASHGNIAGYLVWFTTLRIVSWVSVETIKNLVGQDVKNVSPLTAGCVSQPDDKVINLRVFLAKDIERRTRIIQSEAT